MNKSNNYGDEYFIQNHRRHIESWYGALIKLYYRYIAIYCMAGAAKTAHKSSVLDVGCGIGTLTEQFLRKGYQAVGIDVNASAIKQSICPANCCLVKSTSTLEFPDHFFDLVVSREVLEHISLDEIEACIKEWDRISKGFMVHIIAVKERGFSATEDPMHLNVQSEQWWIAFFKRHGYAVHLKPRLFFSPFGSSGYFLIKKITGLPRSHSRGRLSNSSNE